MDPITTTITIILGKYALDKGVELGKEIGPKALETVKEMYTTTLEHLRRRGGDGEFVARKFEEKPQAYEAPLREELEEMLQDQEEMAQRLREMLDKYEQERQQYQTQHGISYQASVTGIGQIAQGPGAKVVGARGVISGGDVEGNIITGDSSGTIEERED